jgi:ribonuclease VapC
VIIDTSALIAILLEEPGHELLAGKLAGARDRRLSAVNFYEALTVANSRKRNGDQSIRTAVAAFDVVVEPVDAAAVERAFQAHLRFGKGRHPAKLNLGDCFAYALAMERDEPLLFVGDDFSKTDVRPA